AGFYFYEHDSARVPIAETVENNEVHRRTDEPRILGIELELREMWHDLLEDLTCSHRLAPHNGILTHIPCVPDLPNQKADPAGYQAGGTSCQDRQNDR